MTAAYKLACADCGAPPVPSLDLQPDGRLLCRRCTIWLEQTPELQHMLDTGNVPAGFAFTENGWWCAGHGYGCEPSPCPCGHTLRCDCREIQAYEH